jgi:class 3 adenylate cyclase
VASFVPNAVLDVLADIEAGAAVGTTPQPREFLGVVLFADISGFTALTEKLALEGNGAEKLSRKLNFLLGLLINEVETYGGDVVKFSGDAVTVTWDCASAVKGDYGAMLLACQCAVAAHEALAGEEMHMHMGVGLGQCFSMHVGGALGRWEYLLAGHALLQISLAEPLAQAGQTVLSPEAWRAVSASQDAPAGGSTDAPEGWHAAQKQQQQQPAQQHPVDVPGAAPAPSGGGRGGRHVKGVRLAGGHMLLAALHKDGLPPPPHWPARRFPRQRVPLMLRYVPAAVHQSLLLGLPGHLAELRPVTAVFAKIGGIPLRSLREAPAVGALMQTLQRCVYRFEGSVNKLLVDDKGLLLLAVFGLPPLAHSDDPERAVGAALAIAQAVPKVQALPLPPAEGSASVPAGRLLPSAAGLGCAMTAAVGAALGIAFCGACGSSVRREYTVLGDAVNLSARLMGKAPPGGVLVDAAVQAAAKERYAFEALPTLY